MITFILGCLFGGFIGITALCLVQAGKKKER